MTGGGILGDEGDPVGGVRHLLRRRCAPARPLTAAVQLDLGDLPERCEVAMLAWLASPPADTERPRWSIDAAAAVAAVAAFDRLTAAPGLRPVGIHDSDGRNGSGTMFGWPAAQALPDPPPQRRSERRRAWTAREGVPVPVGAARLERTLVGDGSAAGWLQLAVAITHLREFGARWHGGRFAKHRLLGVDPDLAGTPGWRQDDDPEWRWLLRPAAFMPVVGSAPESDATVVRFLSWCDYILDAGIWRYEWTFDGAEITWRRERLARTDHVYMV